jgi:two-component sensor histidine kinase
MTQEELFGLSVNVLVCFFIATYLAWQSIRTNQVARRKLHDIQEALELQLEKIRTQDTEKTVMLKEIHHRVKNNLQVITSLLRLQSRELENEEAIIKFKDTTNRVLAMAKIHETMYQSEELSTINIQDYFSSLANDLVHSYMVNFPIRLDIDCKIEKLGLKTIVPIALILNELITNSLKHAFEQGELAKISVHLHEMDHDFVQLIYSDSGTWKTPEKESSFGWELIQALTEQLDGSLEFESKPVTQYTFKFKNLDS